MRQKTDAEIFADTAGTGYDTAEQDYKEWSESGDILNTTSGVQLQKSEFYPPIFAGLLYASFLHSEGKGPEVNAQNFYFPRGHAMHNGQ